MKIFMVGFAILMTLAMISLQFQQIHQREQIIALRYDINKTNNQIESLKNKGKKVWDKLQLNSRNLKAFENDDYTQIRVQDLGDNNFVYARPDTGSNLPPTMR